MGYQNEKYIRRKLECLLFKRQDLITYLENQGFSETFIKEKDAQSRLMRLEGAIDKDRLKPIYFFLSPHLAEEPFNVVVRKEKLKELALRQLIVTKDGMELLKIKDD